jgi:class 3 adenylate cyclase
MSQLPTGTVTLLFTDIEGSTLLLQQLGERYAEMLATCRQLLRTVFQQWNGVEVDTQGDAFFVVFARASDAISAVIDMQCAVASHDWPNGAVVALRSGLHTGEPTRTAEGYVGLDVHHAARIMSAGHGRQVLLSQTTPFSRTYNVQLICISLSSWIYLPISHPSKRSTTAPTTCPSNPLR